MIVNSICIVITYFFVNRLGSFPLIREVRVCISDASIYTRLLIVLLIRVKSYTCIYA